MKRYMRLFAACAVVGLISPAVAADLTMYTYHTQPPFITADGKGLTYELADYLTARSNGALNVKVSVLPRSRLDQEVESPNFAGVVPWVFPAWFKDREQTRYLWTAELFSDRNIIVSTPAKKIEFSGPDVLKGLRFGGVLGHNYGAIDELAKAGELTRDDAPSEDVNLRKVATDRVDVTLLPASTANFLVPQLGIADKLHVSKAAQSEYTRHFLVGSNNPEVKEQIDTLIGQMKGDPAWQEILARYKISTQ